MNLVALVENLLVLLNIGHIIATIWRLLLLLGEYQHDSFNQRFAPIDDEEFLRRCRPGVNPSVALRVRRIVSEALGINYKQVYPEQSFAGDLCL